VTFRRVRVNKHNPHLRPVETLDLVDANGTREASTGTPTSSGDGFVVTWLAPGTRTFAG
jgi:hypothetical protein